MRLVRSRAAGLGLLLSVLLVPVGQAQELPKIAEFYFDEDVAAKPIQALPPAQEDLVEQLMRMREHGRKGVEASVQLAGIAYADGRAELAAKLYEEALANVSANSVQARGIRWNEGWDLYRHGDVAGALQQWGQATAAARGNVDWAPPTLALALWALQRREEAVAWYAAAVRTEPQLWNDPANFPQLLPQWSEADRARLAEVQQAWAAAPPAWP